MDYSTIMNFVHSNPMPVADHFLAISDRNRSGGTTASDRPAAALGEVCETCYVYCSDKAELWRHVRDEHGADRRLACPESGCGKRFFALAMSAAHAEHHRQCVADARPWTCEMCGCLPRNHQAFQKHMVKTHPDAVAGLCGVCYLYTGDVPTLVDHVRRLHGDTATAETPAVVGTAASEAKQRADRTKTVIRCDVCGKQYGNYGIMYKHRSVHGHVDDPFVNRPTVDSSQPY